MLARDNSISFAQTTETSMKLAKSIFFDYFYSSKLMSHPILDHTIHLELKPEYRFSDDQNTL